MNGGGDCGVEIGAPPQPLEWKFSQVFGERTAGEEVQEVDVISAIEFDRTGNHLATGDRGGRVVLFERTDTREHGELQKDSEQMDYSTNRHPEFRYKTEFQSHEPEFDYLKSLEIEEKINKIRWCQTANGAFFLLSTNDKTIKLWKAIRSKNQEKKVKKVCHMDAAPSHPMGNGPIFYSRKSNSCKPTMVNGGSNKIPFNDASIPYGAIQSLQLPVVVTSHKTSPMARC